MRDIDEKMVEHIALHTEEWSCGNTLVKYRPYVKDPNNSYTQITDVYLHGNLIAQVDWVEQTVKLFSRGYRTTVTKNRLNSICTLFNLPSIQSGTLWIQAGQAFVEGVVWTFDYPVVPPINTNYRIRRYTK